MKICCRLSKNCSKYQKSASQEPYLYRVVSIDPNIKIEELVEEFNYESIIQSGISQYKIIRQYTEEDSIIEKENMSNGKYSFFINYIFPLVYKIYMAIQNYLQEMI
jgi:hypothetical protein